MAGNGIEEGKVQEVNDAGQDERKFEPRERAELLYNEIKQTLLQDPEFLKGLENSFFGSWGQILDINKRYITVSFKKCNFRWQATAPGGHEISLSRLDDAASVKPSQMHAGMSRFDACIRHDNEMAGKVHDTAFVNLIPGVRDGSQRGGKMSWVWLR